MLQSVLEIKFQNKVGLSYSKKSQFHLLQWKANLKMINDAFYFIFEALFFLKVFIFLF